MGCCVRPNTCYRELLHQITNTSQQRNDQRTTNKQLLTENSCSVDSQGSKSELVKGEG